MVIKIAHIRALLIKQKCHLSVIPHHLNGDRAGKVNIDNRQLSMQ
jgi:hypothetical protein